MILSSYNRTVTNLSEVESGIRGLVGAVYILNVEKKLFAKLRSGYIYIVCIVKSSVNVSSGANGYGTLVDVILIRVKNSRGRSTIGCYEGLGVITLNSYVVGNTIVECVEYFYFCGLLIVS